MSAFSKFSKSSFLISWVFFSIVFLFFLHHNVDFLFFLWLAHCWCAWCCNFYASDHYWHCLLLTSWQFSTHSFLFYGFVLFHLFIFVVSWCKHFHFLWLVSITAPIGVVSLCFVFVHIYISCLHHAIFVYIYISCFQLVDMVLVFASHLHYNPITSTWCLFLHHMCTTFVFALQMFLLSSCLFYIIFFFVWICYVFEIIWLFH